MGKIIPEAENIISEEEGSKIVVEDIVDDAVLVLNHSLAEVKESLEAAGKQCLLIVINEIVNDFEDFPVEIYISKSRIVTSIASVFYDLKLKHKKESDYFCIGIENITLERMTPCDLYLKINDEKFFKVVNHGDVFDQEVYDRYSKKANELWVTRMDFYNHASFLYGQTDLEAEANISFSVEKPDHLALIHDMAKSCGISEKTLNSVENCIGTIKEHPDKKIRNLLDKFNEMKGSFLYSHSYFTSLIAIEVASAQKWFKHQHMDKLIMASIMHDMGYKDKDNALCEGLPLSKIKLLDPLKQDDIIGHVDRVLELLEDCPQVDSDVINMIKRHHGGRGEESYPQKSFATELDLLGGIFLLSHAFTTSFFKVAFDIKKLDHVLAYIEMIYNKGNLKKIFPEFKNTLKEKIIY